MKVLHCTPRIYPEFQGGTEIHVHNLCTNQAKSGINTIIFTLQKKRIEPYTVTVKNDNSLKNYTFALPLLDTKPTLLKHLLIYKIRLVYSFIKVLIKERPDIVHFHHLIGLSAFLPLICQWIHVPYVLDIVDYWYICPGINLMCKGSQSRCSKKCFWDRPDSPFSSFIKKRNLPFKNVYSILTVKWHRFFWRTFFAYVKGTVRHISHRTKTIYEEQGFVSANTLIVPCGIELFLTKTKSYDLSKHITVTYIGSLSNIKGVDILIDAVKNINNQSISVSLYGPNPYPESYWNKLIGQDTRILTKGPVDHIDIPQILAQTDILVVPSVCEETFSLTVQEGLMARVPVIASAIGAIPERITDGVNGFLVKPGDSLDLKKKILYLIKNYSRIAPKLTYTQGLYLLDEEANDLELVYKWIRRKLNNQ